MAARRSSSRRVAAAPMVAVTDMGLPVEIRRSARARRISLRVSRLDGKARVTAPLRCAEAAILSFLDDHGPWLAAAVERAPSPVVFAPGVTIPFRGDALLLEASEGRRGVWRDPEAGRLRIAGPESQFGARVEAWLRESARARLLARSEVHAAALGVSFNQITIRDTRSRWGSCSSRGALSYCWRLILAPDDVLDYVAAHEAAHLREMNHSARFWAHVERLRPDWRRQREWLRDHGAELHRYQGSLDARRAAA